MTGTERRLRLGERLRQTAPGHRYPLGRILAIYAGLMIAVCLAALDQTIVATALPHIVSDIGGISSYAWVFSAYLLCQTIAVPLYGKLGDLHGRRRPLLAAIVIFLIGSALCGFAQTMWQLIVFRGVQGLGAGGLQSLALATVGDILPARERAKYQGLIGAMFGVSSIVGPQIGGLIVDATTWRWIFYVNLPIGALGLAVIAVTMPRAGVSRQHVVDWAGAALLALGTTVLLLGLLWGGKAHPWASGHVLGAIAASLVVFALFARRERRVAEPILPFSVVRAPIVGPGALCTTISAMCMFGTISYVPLFLQGVAGFSASRSGVATTLFTLGAVFASVSTGQWISRTGRYRGNVLLGPIVLGTGMLLLWRLSDHTDLLHAAVGTFVSGMGIGLMMQTYVVAAQNSVPYALMGTTTAFLYFSRTLGMMLGTVLFGVIVNQGLPGSARRIAPLGGRLTPLLRDELGAALHRPFVVAACLSLTVFAIAALGVHQRTLQTTFDELPVEEPVG